MGVGLKDVSILFLVTIKIKLYLNSSKPIRDLVRKKIDINLSLNVLLISFLLYYFLKIY